MHLSILKLLGICMSLSYSLENVEKFFSHEICDLFTSAIIIYFIVVLEMDDQLRRLEAVTNRLESFISQLSSAGVNGQSNGNDDLANNVDNLPILRDYDILINESVKPFLNISQKIGGDLTTMNDHVTRLFNAQQQFLRQAVQSKKPSDQQLMEAVKPQSNEIESITGIYIKYFILHIQKKNFF
jgi:division protein CdvB (Snf7/Vps24/ESCRT-III family)